MKANGKYTALEILQEAGIENPQDVFGKMRVRIAGIAGIVKPNHLITIQSGVEKIDVIVGAEKVGLELEQSEEKTISSEAKMAIEKKAEKIKKETE